MNKPLGADLNPTVLNAPSTYPRFEGATDLDELFNRDPKTIDDTDLLKLATRLRQAYHAWSRDEEKKLEEGKAKKGKKAKTDKPEETETENA